jgi:hypothetical protein
VIFMAALSLVVAGPGAVPAAAAPGGPSQPVPGAAGWLDDQSAEQGGDLVAGQRDLIFWWRAGMLGGGRDGEERQREHGQGGPPVPGVPAADLLRELMERMGHTSARAALIYLHATSERQRNIADAVGATAQTALQRASGRLDEIQLARMWHAEASMPLTPPCQLRPSAP